MSDLGNAFPSQNPADLGTLGGVLRATFRKLVQATDGMLPATVIAVDAMRQFATVKPIIKVLATDNTLTGRAQIAKVPVLALGAGNFILSFPIAAGDLGWILASDRDISLYLQSNAESGPNSNRLHSFEDGLFIPDKARQWAIADEDAQNAVWSSIDNTIKITIGPNSVKVKHPTLVEFDAPNVTMSGNLSVQGDIEGHGNVKVDGNLEVDGTVTAEDGMTVDGDLHVTGTVTGDVDVVAGTISGKTHTHGGVTTGGGHTHAPDP